MKQKKKGITKEKVQAGVVSYVKEWLEKIQVLIVGPGLGRDECMLECTAQIITNAKELKLPIVVDADGLWILTQKPQLIRGYANAIITPNPMEFSRLFKAAFPDQDPGPLSVDVNKEWKDRIEQQGQSGWIDAQSEAVKKTAQLAKSFGGVTILRKGQIDIITNGEVALYCGETGQPRRCGGQGDMLAGLTGLFFAWGENIRHEKEKSKQDTTDESKHQTKKKKTETTPVEDLKGESEKKEKDIPIPLIAAWSGCFLIRQISRTAFQKHLRATTTTDMLGELPGVFQHHFPVSTHSKI